MSIDPKQCNKLKFCEYRKTKLVQNVEIKMLDMYLEKDV